MAKLIAALLFVAALIAVVSSQYIGGYGHPRLGLGLGHPAVGAYGYRGFGGPIGHLGYAGHPGYLGAGRIYG